MSDRPGYDSRTQSDIAQDIRAIRHARTHDAIDGIVRAMKGLGRYTDQAHREALYAHRRMHDLEDARGDALRRVLNL